MPFHAQPVFCAFLTLLILEIRQALRQTLLPEGVSIPASSRRHLFERFEQGQPSAKKSRDGAGLGLAIVKEICVLHQADISITSSTSKTCFLFKFRRQET